MKHNLYVLLSLLVLASMVLVACGTPVAPETEGPATAAPETDTPMTAAPTDAPTEVATAEPTPIPDIPIATFDGKTLSVPAEECNGGYGGFFQSIEATDPHTVTFNLCKSDPAFLSKLSFGIFAMYSKDWIEATAGEENRTTEGLENVIGTGPYVVSEWSRGESLTLTANPDYWGDQPVAETLVFRWSTESAARLLELQSGTVDGIDNVGPEDFEVVEADANLKLMIRPALTIMYFGMTNTFPPFDDVRVRKAIGMGIDRQRIVDNFYPAGSEVASHFTPCVIPNGCEGEAWYDFDVEAAKALLAEAGYPDGFSTKLYYRDVVRPYVSQQPAIMQDLQAQLKENLNIDAEIEVMEGGAFLDQSGAGQLNGIHLLGWTADYPHITNFLDYHFGKSTQQFGPIDPSIYEPLIAGGQIPNPEDAKESYAAANNALRELVPMVPIAHGASATAYKADVTNPQASPLGNEYFAVADPGGRDVFVWMQNAEPLSLFCADETDGESFRACQQVTESLFTTEINSTELVPALAESCEPNEDLTVWVCKLRQGVKFHDGSDFDAEDVLATFDMGLNPASPNHRGRSNLWEYYDYLWGLMDKPAQ